MSCRLVPQLNLWIYYWITKVSSKISFNILHEHQRISTNATVSKVSDFGFTMVVCDKFFQKYFEVLLQNRKYVSIILLYKYVL